MKAAILGGGTWGTALALCVARAGHTATLWCRKESVVEAINTHHCNPLYLGGVPLSDRITATLHPREACVNAAAIFVAVPAQKVRSVLNQFIPYLCRPPLVLCAKGLEERTGAFMSEVASTCVQKNQLTILSGPNFAHEVAEGKPTTSMVAGTHLSSVMQVAHMVTSRSFRVYTTDDLVGLEVCGAVKNVLAIACGIVMGRQLGDNARASVIARGMEEMRRFSDKLGGRMETLMSVGGLGDLVLTCTSLTSRNMAYGYALGQGKSEQETLPLCEGRWSAEGVRKRARSESVRMPIIETVSHILNRKMTIEDAIITLLKRPLRGHVKRAFSK